METTSKWRWGVNRWFILLFVILGATFAALYPPVRPHIQVAAEKLTHDPLFILPWGEKFYLTNTMVAMLILDVLVISMGLTIRNAVKSGSLVPAGLAGGIEALLEVLYNLTESAAGKWTKKIFPWFAGILLVVLMANWMELIPGVDSIGVLEKMADGHAVRELLPGLAYTTPEEVHAGSAGFVVVPFVRALSTDLNFTAALALIAVIMVQVIGVQVQGLKYFTKFFNTTTLFTKPGFGAIDLAVSILELISEFSKILSFSFRLFGNIFAGSVLLFLVGSMVPVFAQSLVLLFEFFIGAIQAFVFGMLTMVFMSQATRGHGDEEHH